MSISTPEFHFISPPEAPVFKPTWEEFQDALAYINKIRPIAEQSGICKIIPPPDWQPPFAVDVDNFKFTPRIQRLNELEAHTRIKLNFLDQIAKFWELQGSSLKIPVVERKALDLYSLHKHVNLEGGADAVTKERKWNKVATRMSYPTNKNLGTLLKSHYERIIHPYDIFNKGKAVSLKKEKKEDLKENVKESSIDKDYRPHKIPSRMAGKIPDSEKNGRRSRRYPENQNDRCDSEGDEDGRGSKELKRLQFYGAGPKMAGFDTEGPGGAAAPEEKSKTRGKKIEYYDYDPLAKYICLNCGRGDAEDQMLLCDGCDDSYHTFCLIPRLPEIPKGDWRCPKCVAVEVSKPLEAFGFEQAQKEYTLQSFGEMADKFKQDYFSMPVHLVPLEMAEREFWRIVSSIDEDVTVEYGADLHTMDHGSGFPTKSSKNLLPADQEYALSSWNLNNLPIVEGSVLGHINCDISGMKVPWMGEPKTWYGVPGSMAESFENSMRNAAPELFEAQPDLLHQLVTIMNPNIVMKSGVPVVRTDQHAGEFIITFPRSYHAGFNQGYNFAEAVNFCPPDWLSIGRECVLHYSNLKRYCVFSHDELVCKMATEPNELDLTVAAATYQDLLKMVDLEKKLRKNLLHYGISNAEREAFELLPDDERQCDFCKTTCFLSAVTCSCTPNKLVCLRHYKLLCECPGENKTLRYRYTLDELPPMLHKLKIRAESYDNWAAKVKAALEAKPEDKLELKELRELVEDAENHKFNCPDNELLQTLIQAVTEADKCATVAAHLSTKKVRTRTRGTGETKTKLTLEELVLFCDQIESLACTIKEGEGVKDLMAKVTSFQEEVRKVLEDPQADAEVFTKHVEAGLSFDIDLPELPKLKCKLQQISWTEEVEECMEDKESLTLDCIRKLLAEGLALPPSPTIERLMAELQEILTKMERWEEKATHCLSNALSISEAEALLTEAESIPAQMSNISTLKEAVKRAKEWVSKVEAFEGAEHSPLLEVVENLVAKGKPIPLKLDQLPQLEEEVASAHAWLEKTSRIFLKKNSHQTLLEILLPRTDIGVVSAKRKRVKKDDMSPQQQLGQLLDISFEDAATPSVVVKAYKDCEERELGAMRAIRSHNKNKSILDEEATFCTCHKAYLGNMLTCSLCFDQFHVNCVPIYHRSKTRIGGDLKFICTNCERSKRPKFETILSCLVSLQAIKVRIPEGEALQCLTERAMAWQDNARSLLESEEIASALLKMNNLSQKLQEIYNKQEDEGGSGNAPKRISAENSERVDLNSSAEGGAFRTEGGENGGWGEHAYSTNKGGRKVGSNSSAVSSLLAGDSPLVTLSPDVLRQLQDLLIIGELLELSMDEVGHMWRVVQCTSKPLCQLEEVLASIVNPPSAAQQEEPKPKKAVQKKRKSDAEEGGPKSPSRSPIKKLKGLCMTGNSSDKSIFSKGLKKKPGPKCVTKATSKRKKVVNRIGSGKKGEKQIEGDVTTFSSESEEEIDEQCAAEECIKPYGSNVQWVQCDGCDLWFHYACVGISQKDITEDEDYLCLTCRRTNQKTFFESTFDIVVNSVRENDSAAPLD
ncbi:Lysine-specific demethylase 5A [Armadillidium vulgare]|nr:Lysine-specific demethylase 5A [Armadillidium vulgare]